MRIVEVPAGTIVAEVDDDPSCAAVLAWATALAARQRRDVTLVHALAVEERFGTDPQVLREVVAGLVGDGQELLEAAHDEVRRLAPAVRTRQVLRLVGGAEALDDLARDAAEIVVADRDVADGLRARHPEQRCSVPPGTKVPETLAVGH